MIRYDYISYNLFNILMSSKCLVTWLIRTLIKIMQFDPPFVITFYGWKYPIGWHFLFCVWIQQSLTDELHFVVDCIQLTILVQSNI